jgi:ubiquinone/menaquinone biosynthesis C-methylase UbiE
MNKPDFSDAEKQLLMAVHQATRNNGKPGRETLREFGKAFFGDDLADWNDAFANLTERELLREVSEVFSLSEPGREYARELVMDDFNKGFSKHLLRCEQSRTHSLFCERVYGKNLCQCDMMDMEQLQMLLEILSLGNSSRVLELGCGIGAIAEYISDETGARIVGIDIAEGAVARAHERTAEKRDRLTFQVGDMNAIDFPEARFDTIISIDTLYFVENIEQTVARMRTVLQPGGQMGVFYSEIARPEHSKEVLLADNTKFAQALKKHNLNFRTYDYTANDETFWTRSRATAEELKSDFEAEGNLEMYKGLVEESERLLEVISSGRSSRYLYHVRQD